MATPFFAVAPRRPSLSIAAGWWMVLCLFRHAASAADVLVVTDSHHPVQSMTGARVIELDLAARIEAELASGLPADPNQAASIAQQRLRDGGEELRHRMGHAYQDMADTWGLGVATLPAVVVDRRYVVYGDPDVARAVAHVETFRQAHP